MRIAPGGMLHSQSDPSSSGKSHNPTGKKFTGVLNLAFGSPELIVDIIFNGHTMPDVPAIIDTGAYSCMISPLVVEYFNLGQSDQTGQYQHPSLGIVQTPVYDLSFLIKGFDVPLNQSFQIMPQMYDWGILLGTQFLKKCTFLYYGKKRYFELEF